MFVVSACGSDDDAARTPGAGHGDQGGEIKIGTTGLDNADPVMFQTTQAVQAFQLAYVPLLTLRPQGGRRPAARSSPASPPRCPRPTNGGKTYEFTAARGPEVQRRHPRQGQRLREHDQAAARAGQRLVLLLQPDHRGHRGVPGEGRPQGRHLGHRDGRQGRHDQDHADRAGHEDPVRARRAVRVSDPGGQVAGARACKQPPPGVGPYVARREDFNRLYTLTRNKNWTDIPGIPKGNFDKITGQVSDSVTKMTQDVITGKLDFMTEDPTGDQLPEVRQKYADRYSETAEPAERLLQLPERHDAAVRQAGGAARPSTTRSTATPWCASSAAG